VVTDSLSCTDSTGVITISNALAAIIDISIMTVTNSSCGSSNGSITGVTVSGGTLPYSYSWSDGATEVSTSLDLMDCLK